MRAAHIKILPGAGGAPLLDLVIAETKADYTADVCNPDKQIPGLDGKICPDGSSYDAMRGLCIIAANPAQGVNSVIVVGRPFQGPSGGSVIPLVVAQKRYPNSPCVKKGGGLPNYVVLGTNGKDKITGTNKPDRILGLAGNDSLDGGRGSDCVDAGSGTDRVTGGIGSDKLYGMAGNDTLTGNLDNDRIYGGAGNDHLNGGPGKDLLDAGSGNDTVNAGFNADKVYGGAGNDAINVATAGPAASVNCGAGKDKLRENQNEKKKNRGCEIVYTVR